MNQPAWDHGDDYQQGFDSGYRAGLDALIQEILLELKTSGTLYGDRLGLEKALRLAERMRKP
jgi:hypothetical protein